MKIIDLIQEFDRKLLVNFGASFQELTFHPDLFNSLTEEVSPLLNYTSTQNIPLQAEICCVSGVVTIKKGVKFCSKCGKKE